MKELLEKTTETLELCYLNTPANDEGMKKLIILNLSWIKTVIKRLEQDA